MAKDEISAEDELREATWQWATRVAIALALIGAGYFGGYMQYGDAVELRTANKEQKDRIVRLENERETSETRVAKERRDREVCQKELRALKDAQ